ncbi:MAG: N-acetyltransferase [Methylobacterium sp.]|nr:MAG: N-acetyltransferase [Methylobacterium sp.]
MQTRAVDRSLLQAWLSGRSYARGVPQPVDDHGGFRVDSNTDAEIARWVFPEMAPGLADLAHALREPRHFLKLCGTEAELRSALPARWHVHAPNWFMQAGGETVGRPLPPGYRAATERTAMTVHVRLWSEQGALAASGYAGETDDAFVYDRIVTAPEHRRRGLGAAVMRLPHAARRNTGGTELLVATDEGRALYTELGWRTISPYSTASILPS